MTKNENRNSRTVVALVLSFALLVPGLAMAEKGGKGGGKGGGGNGNGGDITPAKITFSPGGRIDSDGQGSYVHEGEGGLEVYLGTGGAEGDIFFRLGNAPGRGLWLDFSVCATGDPLDCTPPYGAKVDYDTSIAVAPGDVVASGNGLFGIPEGETIYAPVEIFYSYTGLEHPGKIFFDPGLKGRNPCKNLSLNVAITRPGPEELWVVWADDKIPACATLPGGGGNNYSGQYDMTFSFTIETLP
jgi:hypothetical protein